MASQGPSPISQPPNQAPTATPGAVRGASSPAPGTATGGQQPQQTTQAAHPTQPAQSQQQQQPEFDPISKVKVLVPHLKESLSNLMKVSAHGFQCSALIDNASQKAGDVTVQRFDKNLEEFYSICDQVELYLRLGLDGSAQYVDSVRHTPLPLSTAKSEAPTNSTDSQTYNQYVSTVKSQISYAREIHDALLECSNKLGEGKPSS
ncbi:mediator of RNA polymerase II transcription subunit 29-like [Asterias rubens]|uniref:mediator of RNA polymerase II transcription subunit 29-like n=1 Tax=Asterias rubens TaxID=7604 RepID=UPI001454E8DE|nr:mediator of RNA polymerase II transcription subunit 29-like [Asterias rubens]